MRKYLYSENGFTEKAEWQPNCWVNVECPDNDDFKFLTEELKVPESFLEDIADVDERPRTETEDNWLLTILRIPMQSNQRGVPFITVPIGIITNDGIIVFCLLSPHGADTGLHPAHTPEEHSRQQ